MAIPTPHNAAKKEDISADTSTLDHKIDQLVYSLYGLTAEEIKSCWWS